MAYSVSSSGKNERNVEKFLDRPELQSLTMIDTPLQIYLVAISHILWAAVFIGIYLVCFRLIVQDKSLMCKAYYKFTIFMIFVEILQLISVGVAPASFLLRGTTDPLWVNHVFGAVVSASWFTYSFLIHMIAVNRFVCMYFQSDVIKTLFSDRNVHLIIAAAYVYGLIWLIIFLTGGRVSFDLSSFVYLYEKDNFSQKVRSVEIVVDVGNGIAILCWYILIFWKLKSKNNQISDRTISARNAKIEMKVFIQAALLCFMTCFLIFTWFVIPIITENEWVDLGTNYVWLLVASLNAILYLTFNKKIRQHFCAILFIDRFTKSSTSVNSLVANAVSTIAVRENGPVKNKVRS